MTTIDTSEARPRRPLEDLQQGGLGRQSRDDARRPPATTEFIVSGIPGSPYVRSAILGLEEKAASWQLRALGVVESKSPSYLKLHPFGRVPALGHGDFELYETQAILRYLDRIIPEPSLTPKSPRAEARMNQLCGITDWYVMPHITMGITFDRMVAPRLGLPVDESQIAASIPRAEVCVAEIARLLGDQPFLAGDAISIADLLLAPHLSFFAETPESVAILAPHRMLAAWIERMNARPALRNTTAEKLAANAQAGANRS
jgi:glutathione S-transferase